MKQRKPPRPGRNEQAASMLEWGSGARVEPSSLKNWLFAAALTAVVFLVYQPAWRGGPIWDDDHHLTPPQLRSWHGLYRIWFDVGASLQYYPLVHSVFWIEHRLWGDATLGYHLVNIFLHCTAAIMVASILRRLAVPGAYLAAAIFALHPVQAESVAWITELKNTLSGVLYLGAAMLYLRFDQTRKIVWYPCALGLFVLALLTKTVTATLPGALLVIFWWQRGKLSWIKDVLPLVPLFLLGAGMGMVTAWWELKINHCDGPADPLLHQSWQFTGIERILIAGRGVWFHLGKLFWPARLAFIYPRWQIDADDWRQYLYPLGAAALLAAAWAKRNPNYVVKQASFIDHRGRRAPLAALLFFGGTLFPVMGFFNLYTYRYSFIANHYQYLACLGIIALFSAGATLLLRHFDRRGRVIERATCAALLAVLAFLTWRESFMYADADTLYRTTIARNPDCWMAHFNLGNDLKDRGQFNEAISHYENALKIKPDFADAYVNLGVALAGLGEVDEAFAHYQKALEIDPNSAAALASLGGALFGRGQFDEAIASCRKALDIKPDDAKALANLGTALAGRGQLDEAVAHLQRSLDIKPDDALVQNNLGGALLQEGRFEEAIAHFQKALSIDPHNVRAARNLTIAFQERDKIFKAKIRPYGTATPFGGPPPSPPQSR